MLGMGVLRTWAGASPHPTVRNYTNTFLRFVKVCVIIVIMDMKRIIIIGGGAAGMTAAVSAAQDGAGVVLLEKNSRLGAKILITGGGRCNVTNTADAADMIQMTLRNPHFLYSALYGLDSAALVEKLGQMGLATKVEDSGRVFPQSDSAADVVEAFVRRLRQLRVDVRLNSAVAGIVRVDAGFEIQLMSGETIRADAVIVATGGLCAPHTGSDGDGYAFAKGLGHGVTKLYPSLVPVNASVGADLMGLGLDDVGLCVRLGAGGEIAYSGRGGLMFTHFGLSGPVVITATAYLAEKLQPQFQPEFVLDFAPNFTENELDKHVVSILARNSNKSVVNALSADNFLPQRLAAALVAHAGLDGEVRASSVSKIQRGALCTAIKGYCVKVGGTAGFGNAVITCGGVRVNEVDPSTMQSRLVPQLFFAGEVLDVDALTGGYNLHIAFATGWLAGESAGGLG